MTPLHHTNRELAIAKIPQKSLIKEQQQEKEHHHTKNASNSRDPAPQHGSNNKNEGHIKDASINKKGMKIRNANGNSSKYDHRNSDELSYSIGMPASCRNVTARFTCCTRDDMNTKDMLEEPCNLARKQQKASNNRYTRNSKNDSSCGNARICRNASNSKMPETSGNVATAGTPATARLPDNSSCCIKNRRQQ